MVSNPPYRPGPQLQCLSQTISRGSFQMDRLSQVMATVRTPTSPLVLRATLQYSYELVLQESSLRTTPSDL